MEPKPPLLPEHTHQCPHCGEEWEAYEGHACTGYSRQTCPGCAELESTN